MERVDILVLGGQVHGTDANAVNIRVFQHPDSLLSPKITIEDSRGEEVGPSRALKRGRNFDHPINHLGAIFFAHIMGVKRGGGVSLVSRDQVLVDLCE